MLRSGLKPRTPTLHTLCPLRLSARCVVPRRDADLWHPRRSAAVLGYLRAANLSWRVWCRRHHTTPFHTHRQASTGDVTLFPTKRTTAVLAALTTSTRVVQCGDWQPGCDWELTSLTLTLFDEERRKQLSTRIRRERRTPRPTTPHDTPHPHTPWIQTQISLDLLTCCSHSTASAAFSGS